MRIGTHIDNGTVMFGPAVRQAARHADRQKETPTESSSEQVNS